MKSTQALNSDPRRLAAFVAGAAAAIVVGIPVTAFITVPLGVSQTPIAMAVASAVMATGILALSAMLLRSEGETLRSLGLPLDSTRARQFALGFLVSTALFLAVAWAQSALVGATWSFQGGRGVASALVGLVLVTCMVLFEELLFRGLALRYLRRLSGDGVAIVVSALAFGAYHLIGSNDWAMGAAFRFLMPALGGLLFGWAAVRSNGLALPIGLHLGGNWVQASVAGFSPAWDTSVVGQALWQIPITASDMQRLVAPELLPRLPYLLALAIAAAVTWVYLRPHVRQTIDAGS